MTTHEAINSIHPSQYRALVAYAQRKLWRFAPEDAPDVVQEAITRALAGTRIWKGPEKESIVDFLCSVIRSLVSNIRKSWWRKIATSTALLHADKPLTDGEDDDEFFCISVPPVQHAQAETAERIDGVFNAFRHDRGVQMLMVVRVLGCTDAEQEAVMGGARAVDAARKRFRRGPSQRPWNRTQAGHRACNSTSDTTVGARRHERILFRHASILPPYECQS